MTLHCCSLSCPPPLTRGGQFYWLNINVAYDGDVYYTVILNSFVHLVMYFYYFLT